MSKRSENHAIGRDVCISECFEDGSVVKQKTIRLAQEAPIEVRYNGIYYVIMMMTPADLEDFAVGFSITEEIVDSLDDIKTIDVSEAQDGYIVNIGVLHTHLRRVLSRRKRAIPAASGCGICGGDRALFSTVDRLVPSFYPSINAIFSALKGMKPRQVLNQEVHFLHASAWCGVDGTICEVREDIGRHNSLDKLIGRLCRQGATAQKGFCLITSRCSYEMVKKAIMSNMGCLVALSGASYRAFELAKRAGLVIFFKARGKKIFCSVPATKA